MSTPHFHPLFVKASTPLTADALQITLAIPPDLRDALAFKPGQFVTLRAMINGESVRRSYSLCSTPALLDKAQEIAVGIKRVEGGVFSNWAATALQVGDQIDVMPPDGRFTPRSNAALLGIAGSANLDSDAARAANAQRTTDRSIHRVGFAAGSGITPILSIMAHTLASEPDSRFTLVYGNQRANSIMFSEELQNLKDSYPARVNLLHILSRQSQEIALFNGRIDEAKVAQLLGSTLPAASIDEAFICGPEAMIEAAERALLAGGVPRERVHAERFASMHTSPKKIAVYDHTTVTLDSKTSKYALEVVLDGKSHSMGMNDADNVLDTALDAGLDLPYACKGGVCCTCRAKVLEGKVSMDKNFTLEQWEIDKGFVLTCQARCVSARVVVSYDER
jgi:ring-1,2-phenylacetyl-CoA epoxidase subunit PaaE